MIHRLITEDWPLIFPAVAFLVATLIAVIALWGTAGLKPTEARSRLRHSPGAE